MFNCIINRNQKILLIALTTIVIFTTISGEKNETTKLVIDTDAGADDAVAIVLMLATSVYERHNFEVVAITCVFGNTEEKHVEQNVLKILTIANRTDIPVYGGVKKPLKDTFYNENYFGNDGFGDFDFGQNVKGKVDDSIHASLALVNLAQKYKGNLNILAIGPLTNIATAITLDPNFLHNVKQLYVMGGSVLGIGNKSPGVEYNFGHDPDAAYIVFEAITANPIILFPSETASSAVISKDWRMNDFGKLNSSYVKFLNNVEGKSMIKEGSWHSPDAMAAACMISPDISDMSLITNVRPVTDGAARGCVLVDYTYKTKRPNNTIIIQKFEEEYFKSLLSVYVGRKYLNPL